MAEDKLSGIPNIFDDYVEAELTIPGSVTPPRKDARIAMPLGGGESRPEQRAAAPSQSNTVRRSPMNVQTTPLPGLPAAYPSQLMQAVSSGALAKAAAPVQRSSVTAPAPAPAAEASASAASAMPMASQMVRVHRLPPGEAADPRLVLVRTPDAPAAAGFRVLRHRLTERPGLRVVLVTSPKAAEGKTTCALNLALALGEAGRARVLLLEANLRRPTLAKALGFRPPICFSAQLDAHKAQPMQPWVVVESVAASLHTMVVLPEVHSRPFLDGPALALCIEQLRGAGYDYIVVDSPPVLGSADVNLIQESVDGTLLAMWAKRSRVRAMRATIAQLGKEKIVGVALMGA